MIHKVTEHPPLPAKSSNEEAMLAVVVVEDHLSESAKPGNEEAMEVLLEMA